MRKIIFFIVTLATVALLPLSAQTQIFNQPYSLTGTGYTSTFYTAGSIDYEVAEDFSGLTEPIGHFTFYGLAGIYDGTAWIPGTPAATEPFFIKFYNLESGWTQPPVANPGILAPTTGTYTVSLVDSYGDGWNGGMLDVYVNNVLVLNDITLASGAGPESYPFTANAGEYILTVYTAGGWSYENGYTIYDPAMNVLATDGVPGSTAPTGIGVLPEPPLIAPSTGTYTVRLVDSYGDGWNGGLLDVYVNNVQVLNDLTIASGAGPLDFTFPANAGEVIATVYTPGSWPEENYYSILDPALNVIATDGIAGTSAPNGIGFVSTFVILEPEWTSPVSSFTVTATTTYMEPYGNWSLYKYEVDLPAPVAMANGWISAQINADTGSGQWFLWVSSDTGDGTSYQRVPAPTKSTPKIPNFIPPESRDVLSYDMAMELYSPAPAGFTFEVNAYDMNWWVANGYESGVNEPPYNDLNDVNAMIYYDNDPFDAVPPVYTGNNTPYTFVQYVDWLPGQYSVMHPNYTDWIPVAALFDDITTNYYTDFLGYNEGQVPVELSSFTATLMATNEVQVSWVTQSETNMMGFRVYRNESDDQQGSLLITPVMIQATNTSQQQTYSVTDDEIEIGKTYYYWLESADAATSQFFGPVSISVQGEVPPVTPEISNMGNAYPNPFKANSSTNIEVGLKAGENGTVTIYNVTGQIVRSFSVTEGTHMINWNGRDANGNACGSGIYFYKLSTPSINQTRKMVIIK
jgi:hypothetical protein